MYHDFSLSMPLPLAGDIGGGLSLYDLKSPYRRQAAQSVCKSLLCKQAAPLAKGPKNGQVVALYFAVSTHLCLA